MGIFQPVEESYDQELLVIPGYTGYKSSDRLDGNENSTCRCPLGLLKQKFATCSRTLKSCEEEKIIIIRSFKKFSKGAVLLISSFAVEKFSYKLFGRS